MEFCLFPSFFLGLGSCVILLVVVALLCVFYCSTIGGCGMERYGIDGHGFKLHSTGREAGPGLLAAIAMCLASCNYIMR